MNEITIVWAFAAVIFPVFLALPAFISYIVSSPSRALFNSLIISGVVSLVSLWNAIVWTEIYLISRDPMLYAPLAIGVIIFICGVGVTITIRYLAIAMVDVVIERFRDLDPIE